MSFLQRKVNVRVLVFQVTSLRKTHWHVPIDTIPNGKNKDPMARLNM